MDHVRIDEGVKRGSHQPPASWPRRLPPISGKLGPDFDVAPVITRYLNGEELAAIAKTYGVHPNALNYHLLKPAHREAWRDAQVAVSLAEYMEAKDTVRTAPDALCLARAREIARFSQFDLERLEARLFGQKQEITHTVSDDLAERLLKARERLNAAVAPTAAVEAPQQIDHNAPITVDGVSQVIDTK